MKQSLVLPLGKEMLALAATALAFAFHGGDKARGRAVADEVGGSVTWRDSRRQPVRVRGEALYLSRAEDGQGRRRHGARAAALSGWHAAVNVVKRKVCAV